MAQLAVVPRARAVGAVIAPGLAAAAIAVQIGYPLARGRALHALTIAAVVLFASASVCHAGRTRGWSWAARLTIVAAGLGFLAEAIGVGSGVPFGEYAYSGTLGPAVVGVPVIVPLAWLMMSYPCLVLARRLGRGPVSVIGTGAATLASWDLFLDPQMVAAGHWVWANPTPSLPGIAGIPVTNFAGWLVVSVIVMGALHVLVPPDTTDTTTDDTVPQVLLAWTWVGSIVGNAVFFGRPWVAVWGGLAMAVTVVPYLRAVRRDRQAAAAMNRRSSR
jgi:uncharacterized membrane protein